MRGITLFDGKGFKDMSEKVGEKDDLWNIRF